MRYGYACFSVNEIDLAFQKRALRAARCHKIFEDRSSGAARGRLGLVRALQACVAGDAIVVQRLDRLGASPAHVIEIAHRLIKQGVGLCSITEAIDTTVPGAGQALALIDALADFQRLNMATRDRRRLIPAGALKAPRPVRVPDPRFKLSPEDIAFAQQLVAGGEPQRAVAAHLGVGLTTLRRSLARAAGRATGRSSASRQRL